MPAAALTGDATARAERRAARIVDAARRAGLELPAPSNWPGDWHRVLAASDYVAERCAGTPQVLAELLACGGLAAPQRPPDVSAVEAAEDEDALRAALRRERHRGLVRVAWRDIGGLASLDETLAETSALAEALVAAALDRLELWQRAQYGTPRDESGNALRLAVMALGKLGAAELNFSSDVDFIYAYAADGNTDRERRPPSNHEFFVRLGRSLGGVLSRATVDGFAYRVDTRLRPFGASGPQVSSFAALEDYYQAHGRAWERCALTRMRVVAGSDADARALERLLEPFVYRRYPDYSALDALREVKRAIASDLRRRGDRIELKVGRGGIRDAEFVAQALQVACGGREPALREPRTLRVLRALAACQLLPDASAATLEAGYRYLRRVENHVQMLADTQAHALPEDDDALARLCMSLGCSSVDDLLTKVSAHMDGVATCFDDVLGGDDDATESDAGDAAVGAMLVDGAPLDGLDEWLRDAGFAGGEANCSAFEALTRSSALRAMDETSRERMRRVTPTLLRRLAAEPQADAALPRMLALVEAVARRSAYLVLMLERPDTLAEVARLCARSGRAAELLRERPVLLAELVGEAHGDEAVSPTQALAAQVEAARDEEAETVVLREFAAAGRLDALRLLVNGECITEASAHLTGVAEAVLGIALRLARRDIASRHGQCWQQTDSGRQPLAIAVLAYGRLGACEMGLDSDLDLVLVHDDRGPLEPSDGERPLHPQVWAERVAQRLNHLLVTRTLAGQAFEVDFRLRPRGKGGPLCPGVNALRDYLHDEAWTYERQALVRSRVVTAVAASGADRALAEAVARVCRDALRQPVAADTLRKAVVDMRARMARELGRGAGADGEVAAPADLRNGEGGLFDLEFCVQYHVLRTAPALDDASLGLSSTAELLSMLGEHGAIDRASAATLADAHLTLRRAQWRLAAAIDDALAVTPAALEAARNAVTGHWRTALETRIDDS